MLLPPIRSILVIGSELSIDESIRSLSLGPKPPEITYVPTLAEAILRPPIAEVEIVLVNPSDACAAANVTDSAGLPRWAVIASSQSPRLDTATTPIELPFEASDFTQASTSAIRLYLVMRDNARLRGDIATVARRVSHNLFSPLGCILSTSEELKNSLADIAPTDVPLLDSITGSADEITQLVKHVSYMLRATISPLPPENLSMSGPFLDALERLESRIKESHAALRSPAVWPKVKGVNSWLTETWFQLISHRLEHAKDNALLDIGWSESGSLGKFWLNEPSSTPTSTDKSSPFPAFNLLHDPSAPHEFSLAIVRRLVELQGGICARENDPTLGARLCFTLPLAPTERA